MKCSVFVISYVCEDEGARSAVERLIKQTLEITKHEDEPSDFLFLYTYIYCSYIKLICSEFSIQLACLASVTLSPSSNSPIKKGELGLCLFIFFLTNPTLAFA